MRTRTSIGMILCLFAFAGCTIKVQPSVGGPYKTYPRSRRIPKRCVVQIEGPETLQFETGPLFYTFKHHVNIRTAMKNALQKGLQETFQKVEFPVSASALDQISKDDVALVVKVLDMQMQYGATEFNKDSAWVEIEVAIKSGPAAAPVQQRIRGTALTSAALRDVNKTCGGAIIQAVDQLNKYIDENRSSFLPSP